MIFITNRKTKVRLEDTFSQLFPMENRVPQEWARSYIQLTVWAPIQFSLFADDFWIIFTYQSKQSCMQRCINDFYEWTFAKGFNKLSTEKTTCADFHRTTKYCQRPRVFLNSLKLHFQQEARYVGVIVDRKFLWNIYIKNLKRTCIQAFDILKNKMRNWEERKILLPFY